MTKRLDLTLRLLLVTAVLAVAIGPATMARAGTQDFVLVNRTSVEIHELYISSADTDDWEEDVLGVDTLPPGGSVTISFKGHKDCDWDIMVKDEDGTSIEWSGLDLCAISKVTLRLKGKKATADLE